MRLAGGLLHYAIRHGDGRRRARTRGQSYTEFALVFPVFMFVVLIGLDFGRVFMGWVTLQQTARIAANFAAINPTAWDSPGVALARQRYQQLLTNESQGINCDMPSPAPNPTFLDGNDANTTSQDVGDYAQVTLDCQFHILTPVISAVLPNPLTASASAVFPIRVGFTSRAPGSGGPVPVANFATLPSNGQITSGQSIQFIDSSQNNPTTWLYDFGDGSPTSNEEFPSHIYSNPGGYSITRTASLQACNINGCSSTSHTITVLSATPAASACFTANPLSGPAALTVTFTNCTTGATPINYTLDWTNDGIADWSGTTWTSQSHQYATAGTYTAKLTAQNAFNTSPCPASECVRTITITVQAAQPTCTVPSFTGNDPISTGTGRNRNKWTTSDVTTIWTTTSAQWSGGNCHGSIIYTGSTPGVGVFFNIDTQSLTAGTIQFQSTPITFTWH